MGEGETAGHDGRGASGGGGRPGAVTRGRRPRPTRVTLRQVATASGVSASTVSRVLGDVPTTVRITDATRSRVLEHAKAMGYRPDALARGLRGSPTALVGLIVRDLAYPLHAVLIEAIVEAARDEGYDVAIGSSRGLTSESIQLERIIETRMCDGIVMVGGLDDPAHLADDLHSAHLPFVGIGLATTDPRIAVVRSDNAAGARLVLEHLAALGHRRMAILKVGDHPELEARCGAFGEAARAPGLPEDAVSVVEIPNTPAAGADAVTSLLRGRRPPTAIFSTTDHAAYGVLRRASELRVPVPERLSVVGFDDLAMSATMTRP